VTPSKIEDSFIQLTTNYSGVIQRCVAGNFSKKSFLFNTTIFNVCPFLEGTLEALVLNESFLLEGMVIVSEGQEFNVDLEIFKHQNYIDVLIHNRTNVYKYLEQLNQNRNDIFLIKREIDEKNKQLANLRKIADQANEEKSRFLAMMSHEIRNPLNSIIGYAEMISSEKINSQVAQYVKNLTSAGKNLKVIVDDILDLSRIEAGKLELVSKKISITDILQNLKNDYKQLNLNDQVSLDFLCSKEIPEILLGDPVRFYQIVSNLMSNALKFTNKGSVLVSVKLQSESKNKAILILEVADTGRGMSEAQSEKIFNEYEQNELNDNRVHGGYGLGLAIVKRLVNAMNGTIKVESKLDVGSRFFVEIPFDKVIVHKKVATNTSLELKDVLKGKKILVADDDILNQTIAAHILKKENVSITIVNDGLEALSKIENESFDVILLDINMPNMTGDELIKHKKSFVAYNLNTPFLALTANTAPRDVDRYLQLGFLGVISKPFTVKNFIEKITAVI